MEDAALIHELLPAGGTVLDLGCATGRLAEPLAALGHRVTGVDNEPEMLVALRRATGVCAGLDAEQRFRVRDVDDHRLAKLAGNARLRVDSSLNQSGTLVLLRPSGMA